MDIVEYFLGLFGHHKIQEAASKRHAEASSSSEENLDTQELSELDSEPNDISAEVGGSVVVGNGTADQNPLHRPQGWGDFIGSSNRDVVDRLQMAVAAAKKRAGILPHILLYGGAGRGKTTLSRILANEMGAQLVETIGSSINKQADIYSLFLDIDRHQSSGEHVVLFIDEIHDIARKDAPETLWYPVLEEYKFLHNLKEAIITINGEKYRVANSGVFVEPFTIIGATTDPGMLSEPLRDRFPIACYLKAYTSQDLKQILTGYAKRADVKLCPDGAIDLAKRARGTPRTAINLLTACQDRALLAGSGITHEIVKAQMEAQNIDDEGLTGLDISVLKALALVPKGLGLANLAGSSGINKTTISEMVEPLLKQRGYMATTSRRYITDAGITLLKKKGVI